jgi:hypothetical protein
VGWVRRWLGRRRPDFGTPPPCPDASRLRDAVTEARRAEETLGQVRGDDQRVNEAADRAARLRRQNHLGPSFWDWAEHLGERRSP